MTAKHRPLSTFALALLLPCFLMACGGSDDNASDSTSASSASSSSSESSSASSSSSSASIAAGEWTNAAAGDVISVKLSALKPTQGAIGYDEVYYKLGRYELDPEKKFDDYCADDGMDGVETYTEGTSTLTDASSFTCTVTDDASRDTTALPTVIVGPNGDSLYLTDGHHGLSAYYETSDGGPDLTIHVLVQQNLSADTTDEFWSQMETDGHVWLKNGSDGDITVDQLPAGLGFSNGLGNDSYRSLVYFTRGIGYDKPDDATDYLEFYWAEWLRQQSFSLSSYDTTTANYDLTVPADDTSYLGAIWNASVRMVGASATDAIIDGKTGSELGKLDEVNDGKSSYKKGDFGDLLEDINSGDPGKLAYMFYYKETHNID